MSKNVVEKEIRSKFTALFIDPVCMKKINYYTQAADGEISGLGTIIKDKEGRYVVNEVFLFEQKCSAADTELDPEAVSKLMVEMMQSNQDPGKLKFWWHSHVNMGVFWSGTDEAACEILSKEYAFSLVVNKRKESLCRLDLYNPFRVTIDGVKVVTLPEPEAPDPLKDACEKEVKDKVRSAYTPYVYPHARSYEEREDTYMGEFPYTSRSHHGYTPSARSGHQGGYYKRNSETKIKLSEVIIEDITRLLRLAELYECESGIFASQTWDEYIEDTLKAVAEMRLKPKSACNNPLTWAASYPDCTNGKCKVQKPCQYWTKRFSETAADATIELAALETDNKPLNEIIVV